MPSAETITKWVAAIIGGILLALQGVNLKESGDVIRENTEEINLLHHIEARQIEAMDKVMAELEKLKK